MMNIEEKIRSFREYAAPFLEDETLRFSCRLKLDHTMDVLSVARRIMRSEGVRDPRRYLAGELAALFHDLSRFEQLKRFHTFRDAVSFDHGNRSAEMLETGDWLSGGDAELRQEVIAAVRWHNKSMLPETLPENYRFTAQLVRDADKVSIYHVVLDYFQHPERHLGDSSVTLELPEKPSFTRHLIGIIRSGEVISLKSLKCVNDFLLYLLSWHSNVNFRSTFHIIAEEKIYPQLRAFLPPDEEVDRLLEELLRKISA